jgi:hypothetical protein
VTMAGIVRIRANVIELGDVGMLVDERALPVFETIELTGVGSYEVPTLVMDHCD